MAVALRTLPLRTVMRTCTGPYWVSAASPVTVFVADDELVDGEDGEDEREPVEPLPVADAPEPGSDPDELVPDPDVLTAAGGLATDAGWVLNDSSPTSPAMVPNSARATRRMETVPLRTRRIRGGSAGAERAPRAGTRPRPGPFRPDRRHRRRGRGGRERWR